MREASWIALDIRAGGTRAERNRRAREVGMEGLEETIVDPINYVERFHRDLLLDSVERKLERDGQIEMNEVFGLVRLGHTWAEIADHFRLGSDEVLKRRFYRWARCFPDARVSGGRSEAMQ